MQSVQDIPEFTIILEAAPPTRATHDAPSDSSSESEPIGPLTGALVVLTDALASAPLQLGPFSFGGEASMLPSLPGLVIEGYGRVHTPVVDQAQAAAIKRVMEESSFGPGPDTVMDSNVPKSFQISADKVHFENPKWEQGIGQLRDLVAERLGLESLGVELKPYKLLLHEPGGHFAKHRDIEKEDRMFATLVVQLPSAHSGGALLVHKEGEPGPVAHDFGQSNGSAEFACHYAAHYADAEHESTPITKGYRLALTYSVCWPESSSLPTPVSALGPEAIKPIAAALGTVAAEDRYFHYFLTHAYTTQSISQLGIGALKGTDRSRAEVLRHANAASSEQPFSLFIADVKLERTQQLYGDEDPPMPRIEQLYDLDGKSVLPSGAKGQFELHEDDLLNPDHKSAHALWNGMQMTTVEEPLGNEGVSVHQTYRKFVLIAWPRKHEDALMLSLEGPTQSFHRRFQDKPVEPAEFDRWMLVLAKLYRMNGLRIGTHMTWEQRALRARLMEVCERELGSATAASRLLDVYWDSSFLFDQGDSIFDEDEYDDEVCFIDVVTTLMMFDATEESVEDTEWRNAELQAKVKAVFAGNIVDACYMLNGLHDDVQVFMDVVAEAHLGGELPPPETGELELAEVQRALWEAAFKQEDTAVLRNIVRRYEPVDARELFACANALLEIYDDADLEHDKDKWQVVLPLLERRIDWIRQTQEDAAAVTKTWCFHDAVFSGRADVQDFLRGPERKMTLRGFANLQDARNLANSAPTWRQINCSFSMQAGGTDEDAYVFVMKTKNHSRGIIKKASAYDRQLEQLQEAAAGVRAAMGVAAEGGGGEAKQTAAVEAHSGASAPPVTGSGNQMTAAEEMPTTLTGAAAEVGAHGADSDDLTEPTTSPASHGSGETLTEDVLAPDTVDWEKQEVTRSDGDEAPAAKKARTS